MRTLLHTIVKMHYAKTWFYQNLMGTKLDFQLIITQTTHWVSLRVIPKMRFGIEDM